MEFTVTYFPSTPKVRSLAALKKLTTRRETLDSRALEIWMRVI